MSTSRKSNTIQKCFSNTKIFNQITTVLYKYICLKAYIFLLNTSSINNSYVQTTWKESQVKMLPNSNSNKEDAENYRPISLTNCIAKICETAVKNIVLAHCENHDIFGEMQSAYRRNRWTTDNLLSLTQRVTEAFQWSEMVELVCLDIEKAFNAVWRLNKLPQIGVQKPLIRWVNSFLSQRSIFMKIKNWKSSTFSTIAELRAASLHQYSSWFMSAALLKYFYKFLNFLLIFAFYYRLRSCRRIQEKLQYSLAKLINCCEKLKIGINLGKTNFMLFKNPSKTASRLDLFINGTRIEGASSIKFLGVNLSPHIMCNKHCKSLVARANKRIYQLWWLSQINIDEECLLTLYKPWFRPLFLNANACWIDQSNSIINNIKLIQNRALRICVRKPRWFSVKKLHEEANVPAIRDFQILLANDYLKRAKKTRSHQYLNSFIKRVNVRKTVIKAHWTICPANLLYQILYRWKARTAIIQWLIASRLLS